MLEKLRKKMEKAGINAEILRYAAGGYYDPNDPENEHRYYYDVISIRADNWTEFEIARKAATRTRGFKDNFEIEIFPYCVAFHITALRDLQNAKAYIEESNAFHDAFNTYVHEQLPHENGRLTPEASARIDEAVTAGLEAVRRWKAS